MERKVVFSVIVVLCAALAVGASPARAPQRIISLSPATTEILFCLGLGDNIVGVTTFCNYPAAAAAKEKVGTFSQPDIEKILSLRPDIILAAGLEQAHAVENLRQLRLPIYVSDPATIEELFVSIKEIGELTNCQATAQQLVDEMKSEINQIRQRAVARSTQEKPRVFIEIYYDPLMTAGSGSFVDELIQIAGGENIAHDAPRPYSYFSEEQVIARDPECIILGYMDTPTAVSVLRNRRGWNTVSAVKNNRVHDDINPDLFFRPGPRLVEGLKQIYEKLYPDE